MKLSNRELEVHAEIISLLAQRALIGPKNERTNYIKRQKVHLMKMKVPGELHQSKVNEKILPSILHFRPKKLIDDLSKMKFGEII